jgi:hypothetical protein
MTPEEIQHFDPLSGCIASDQIRLLAALGFWAAKSGCLVPAVRIFESFVVLRPGAAFPYIGLSIAYLSVGMHKEASFVIGERAEQQGIDPDQLRVWRALAFFQEGSLAQANAELRKCMQKPPDPAERGLINRLSELLGLAPGRPVWPAPSFGSDFELAD